MKKIIALALIGLAIASHNAFGQAMINAKKYSSYFIIPNGKVNGRYTLAASDEDYDRIAALGGDLTDIDTLLEIALLSMCAGVIDIRPAEADAILPKNNPKLADQKLGAAVFQEIQVLRFLGDTAAVSRHEAVLKWITDRKNATRQEIETFYRDNVCAMIAVVVDEEFNKVSFSFENSTKTKGYNAVLTRNPQTGQYVLSYERPSIQNSRKEVSDTSLDALLVKMRANTDDFDQACVDAVKVQATLIPAVVYADWKAKGIANGTDGLALIKEALTNFYLNPNDNAYLAVFGIQLRYKALLDTLLTKTDQDIFAEVALRSFRELIRNLNSGLAEKFGHENRYYTRDAQRVPNDSRFNIFSTPYSK